MLKVLKEVLDDPRQKLVHFKGVCHRVHEDSVHGKVKAGSIKRSEKPEHTKREGTRDHNSM